MSTLITQSRRYVEVRFGPGRLESVALKVWPDRLESERRRYRATLKGAVVVYCGNGNTHAHEVDESTALWASETSDDDLARLVLDTYEQRDEDAADGLASELLEWSLSGWTDPCPTDTEE